jgi:hypothetical protein
MRKCIVILLLCGACLHGETPPSRAKKLFAASIAAVASAAMADTATSWGKAEANPVLGQSRLGAGQAGLKIGLVSAALAGQLFLMRHHSQSAEKAFTVVNFASAGVLGGIAYRNSTISAAPQSLVK